MEGIQLKVENNNNISVIKVGGYIDTTTSSELEHHLTKLLERGSYNIVIDLGNVDYVSSAGWGIFISEIKGIREKGGDLKLVSMIPEVYEVFELLEFHYILKAFESLEDAIKDFEVSGMVTSAPSPSGPPTREPQSVGAVPMQEARSTMPPRQGEEAAASGSIEDKVKKIIAEKLSVDLEEVVPEASFVDDLGADSLDLVELIMSMEEEFDIDISDEDAEKLITVQDAINYIDQH